MQNTRLGEEKRQLLHISEFERDCTVSNYMEKLVPKTCPWAENLNRESKDYFFHKNTMFIDLPTTFSQTEDICYQTFFIYKVSRFL